MGFIKYAVYMLIFFLVSATLSESSAQTLRILPLGNSITAGNMCLNGTISDCTPIGGHIAVGYRLRLLNLLTAAGYNIDYVGTQTFGNALMSDSDCGGFGGISDARLADVMETGTSTHTGWVTSGPYMNSNHADVVLLHIGTNDILAADTSRHDVDRILDAIDEYETSHGTTVMVFLARIISTRGNPCNSNPRVIAYNRMMDNLAASRRANGDQLILVDMECGAGLDYNNDMMDQVHPNQDGYDKMGQAWFNAIKAWMGPPGPTYTLNMESPSGSGIVTPSVGAHNYAEGTSVSVSANPAAGWEFSSWSGDLVSTQNPASVTMNGNKSIRATFTKLSYQLTMNTDESPGASINPWGSITVDHGVATNIEVTAIPDGYSFDGWEVVSGSSVSISNPSAISTTVTLSSGDASLRANFVLKNYTLTVLSDGTEGVELSPEGSISLDHGATTGIEVTNIPEGYSFDSWEVVSGSSVSIADPSSTSTTVTLSSGDASIRAIFIPDFHSLIVNVTGEGSVEVDPEQAEYTHNSSVNLNAVPASGYTFIGWSGDLEGSSNPTSLMMDGDKNVSAAFALNYATLTLLSDGTEGVALSPEGSISVELGAAIPIEVTKIPDGFSFAGWEVVSGSSVSMIDASAISTMVTLEAGDAEIRANFARHIRVNTVSIPDKAHIIGDTVEAEIQISNDHGRTISLVSGKIGDYPLKNLERSDSSLYLASFIVYEGGRNYRADEDIPVSELVISDGQIQSPVFDGSIIQENDPIDASAPKVHSMTVPDKVFGTGDTIRMDILADGYGYLAGDQSSFNHVGYESGRLKLKAEGGMYYSLSYVVGEDDPAVEAGELEVTLYLQDVSGNMSVPYTMIRDNTLSIHTGTFARAEISEFDPAFYPNPARDYLDIKLGHQNWTGSSLEIVDLSGRIKIAIRVSEGHNEFRLDISGLEAGAYLIRIVNGDASLWTDKLMKTD